MTSPFCAALLISSVAFPATAGEVVLASFENSDSAQAWYSVNDGVMGGVSSGDCKLTEEGTLKFAGKLSLANNGGFSSIRTKPTPTDLTGMEAIVIEAKGDGRTYWVDLRDNQKRMASSYRAFMETKAGEWQTVVIPLDDFKLQSFGRNVKGNPINLDQVSSFGFTLADKKEGPFNMELRLVKAVSDADSVAQTDEEDEAVAGNTIVDVAQKAGVFQTLIAAAGAADLAGALSGEGPLTVFAPTDEAFAKLPEGTVEELLKPKNKAVLVNILKYHVVAGEVNLAKALEVGEAPTLEGNTVEVKFADGRVRIGKATLAQADVAASNGVIHIIDEVLLPPQDPNKSAELTGAGKLIDLAIERGVPLFNGGNEAGCTAVYEVTCEALLALPKTSDKSRKVLTKALQMARKSDSSHDQAWILRAALDQTYFNEVEG